jgi:hypothetical protein
MGFDLSQVARIPCDWLAPSLKGLAFELWPILEGGRLDAFRGAIFPLQLHRGRKAIPAIHNVGKVSSA